MASKKQNNTETVETVETKPAVDSLQEMTDDELNANMKIAADGWDKGDPEAASRYGELEQEWNRRKGGK